MLNPLQTQPSQVPLVRVVGTDTAKSMAQPFQYPGLVSVPNTANASMQQAQQNVTEGYSNTAKMYGQLAQFKNQEVSIYANDRSGENTARAFDKLSENITEFGKVQQALEKAKVKNRQETNATLAMVDSDDLVFAAVEKAKTENPAQARNDAIQLIMETDTSNEDKQRLLGRVFGAFSDLEKEWATNRFKMSERVQAAASSNIEADVKFSLAFVTADLSKATVGQSRVQEILNQVDTTIDGAIENKGLDPITALELRGTILESVLKQANIGAAAKATIAERSEQYAGAYTDITKILKEKYGGDPSDPGFQYESGLIATQNGLPAAFKVYTKDDQFRDKYQMDTVRAAADDLAKKSVMEKRAATQYPLFVYGQQMYEVISGQKSEGQLNKVGDVVVINQLEQWRKDQTKFKALRQEQFSLSTRLSAASNPKDTVTDSSSISPDSTLGNAQKNISQSRTITRGTVDQAQVQALSKEVQLRQIEMQQLQETWKPYGLSNFDSPGTSMQEAIVKNSGNTTLIEEWKKQNPNRAAGQGATSATSPNYRRVPKLMDYQGMVTPFKKGTALQISRTHTEDAEGDGTGHSYPGIDLAVAPNTPTYALFPGKVVEASKERGGGYGLEVIVAMANGQAMRVAHMNSSAVKIGDTVQAGQLIGYSGGEPGHPNAGRSSGPHVHMDFPNVNKGVYNHDGFAEPRTFMKSIPQLLQRPTRGYGLPSIQGMDSAVGLSVLSLANGGYIKDNIYYQPGGKTHDLTTGSSGRVVSGATQKRYDRLNASLGITPEKATEYGYKPRAEALPSELRRIPQTEVKLIAPAQTAFARMAEAASKQGVRLYPISGFRSVNEQASIVKSKLDAGQSLDQILKVSSPPGHSEHHEGTALDIGAHEGDPLSVDFEKTAAFKWLSLNAQRYGFKMSYPQGNKGTGYEPWHWQYSGKKEGNASKISAASPIKVGRAPITKAYYPKKNEPLANYGYDEIKRDPSYARKLNKVADNLGIPGQWLADIIDYEVDDHSPSRWGGSGNAYVGLIQFGAAAAQDMGVSQAQLSSMSRVEQLDYVQKYLGRFKGNLNTIEDVYAAINIGNPYDSPSQRLKPGHGDTWGFDFHAKRLGKGAGRRYQTSYDAPTAMHTTYHQNCSLCNSLSSKGTVVPPHYAS